MALLTYINISTFVTIYTLFNKTMGYCMQRCRICNVNKMKDTFYVNRTACKDCLNFKRRSSYKLSTCRYCKIKYRPGVEGRYKFCSDLCRFMMKVKKQNDVDGCWLWLAGKSYDGYGNFVMNGKKSGLAHRASYQLFNGPIEDGKLILHSCHDPACVNPDHLRQGTDADNSRDKSIAKRGNQPTGEKHHNSKLNEQDVREIRALSENGYSYAKIARMFNVNAENVSFIVRRISWKHI